MGLPVIAVQHHHAHIAAVMAEHGVTGRVIGVAYDGTGYGEDGRVWGAEMLIADLLGFERVAQLRYAPLPGGDIAMRQPWRVALGYLSLAPDRVGDFELAFRHVDERELTMANQQLARAINSPLASSMGRLFDAAASVLGVRQHSAFEGQAAMELEALAGNLRGVELPVPVMRDACSGKTVMDPLPMLAELGRRRLGGANVGELAAALHETVSAATASAVRYAAEGAGLQTVVLGGGCFQNARLLTSIRARLEAMKFRVLVPKALPANDGGVSYGQAAVAAARLAAGQRGSAKR
jgi:hydrogenase maturation protein HypF